MGCDCELVLALPVSQGPQELDTRRRVFHHVANVSRFNGIVLRYIRRLFRCSSKADEKLFRLESDVTGNAPYVQYTHYALYVHFPLCFDFPWYIHGAGKQFTFNGT